MNQFLMIVSFTFLFLNLSIAQDVDRGVKLSSSLNGYWKNGETEKAVESSLELYQILPDWLITKIHERLATEIPNDSNQYGQNYLKQLLLKNHTDINKLITPIYLWSIIINDPKQEDLDKAVEGLDTILGDSANYVFKTELYSLLILQELKKRNAIDTLTMEKILQKGISNLEAYPNIETVPATILEREKRAWFRYMLANNYHHLYLLNPDVAGYLKKASDYSPDQNDSRYKYAYFYDALLLTGTVNEFGFHSEYKKYLSDHNMESETLGLLSKIAFINPTDQNFSKLQDYYGTLKKTELFEIYWRRYFNTMTKPAPKVKVKFEKDEMDLTKEPGHWVFIDVWGTWCGECVRELPDLQSVFVENKDSGNPNLKIFTFSYNSENLNGYMREKKFTFPVIEIDDKMREIFNITEFPTKILISPEGNYIKLPLMINLKMYLKNYTMM